MNTVNLMEWCSQMYLAKKLNVTPARVNNWIKRGKIDHIYVKELCAVLVRNIKNMNELRINRKK